MTTTLVTGANRGVGREVAVQLASRGHHVLLGTRDPDNAGDIHEQITAAGGEARIVELDIAKPELVYAAVETIEQLDVLVNNAAITYDTWQTASNPDFEVIREALDTNLHGTWQLTAALLPALRRSDEARIVNVSSGAGALTDMGSNLPAYRISKVALSALTRMWAAEQPSMRINAVCPGWVATDMGGAGGRPVTEGAAGITWAATLPPDGPTGGFFRDEQPIPW